MTATVLVSERSGHVENIDAKGWATWKRKVGRNKAIAITNGPDAIVTSLSELKALPPGTFRGELLEKVLLKQQAQESGEAWRVV